MTWIPAPIVNFQSDSLPDVALGIQAHGLYNTTSIHYQQTKTSPSQSSNQQKNRIKKTLAGINITFKNPNMKKQTNHKEYRAHSLITNYKALNKPDPSVFKYFPNRSITKALFSGTIRTPQFVGGGISYRKLGSSLPLLNPRTGVQLPKTLVTALTTTNSKI
jgi:hypothetical protein